MLPIALALYWSLLASCTAVSDRDVPTDQVKPNAPRLRINGQGSNWLDPSNHVRPYQGLRRGADGQQVGALMWVIHTPHGQPLGIRQLGSRNVDDYFDARSEAILTQISRQHVLSPAQLQKLRLAAQIDIARLQRLAQEVDGALGAHEAGDHEPATNRLFHSLTLACDSQLFDDSSLLRRVLKTQLASESAKRGAQR